MRAAKIRAAAAVDELVGQPNRFGKLVVVFFSFALLAGSKLFF